jgi:pimeloyl-ACP methyl ester carboxylesterase
VPTLVKMPKWGLTMTAGTVTGWISDEGSEVTAGMPLLTVETEKAVNDVEAPADGVLLKIVAAAGSEVPVSGPVAVIAAAGEVLSDEELAALIAAATPQAAASSATGRTARGPRESRTARRDDSGRVNASPAARKLARDLNVDLATVEATGPGGRITSDDVERAAANDGSVREEYLTLGSGHRLFALRAGAGSTYPPLVFLHGLGGAQTTWANVLPPLVEQGTVIALDLLGHGQSDKPAGADYSVAGLASQVAEALTGLRIPPAVFVGHSLGGAVALLLALERPELVRGLVLVNSAGLGEEIGMELLDRIEAPPSREEARRLLELFFEDRQRILERGVEEMYQARMTPGADAALQAAAAANFGREGQRIGLTDRLGQVQVPTLIVWGEKDRVIPLEHALAALRVLPDGWLKILPGIGHVPQVEAPALFANAVGHFARGIATPG